MTRRAPRAYLVKNAAGDELRVPSLRDLHDLYAHGFLGDDDLVRAESSERWERAGAFEALGGVREVRRESPRRVLLLLAALAALAAGIGLLLAR